MIQLGMIVQCVRCGAEITEIPDGDLVMFRRTNYVRCPKCGKYIDTETFDDEILKGLEEVNDE